MRLRRWGAPLLGLLTALPLAAGGLVLPPPAQSAQFHPGVVSENPDNNTAELVAGEGVSHPRVNALARGNGRVFVGGWFGLVRDGERTEQRTNFAVLDENGGRLLETDVRLNNRVWALATYGEWVFIGGQFSTVNGGTRRFLVKVHGTTGAVDPGFRPTVVRGRVNDLEVARGMLFVGGAFPQRLVALDPDTGADTGYLDLDIAGEVTVPTDSWGRTTVYEFAISPDATRLVAVGNFATVNGQGRLRAFMANLGARGTLSDWYYTHLNQRCATTHPRRVAYLQGVDFSPDGSYFVVVATGQIPEEPSDIGVTVCDAAARFDTDVLRPNRPAWINYTGGDSLWSTAVTGSAVYVQGHHQWLDNPRGFASQDGGGAVRRVGIGAIDPVSGRALPWDPRKPAKVGGEAFLATPSGLWVGSDSLRFAGEPRRGLAFVPLAR